MTNELLLEMISDFRVHTLYVLLRNIFRPLILKNVSPKLFANVFVK